MYSYCYVCSVLYIMFSLYVPTGTLRLPWLCFFRAFSSAIREIPGYSSQRQGMARTLPKLIELFYSYVLLMCKCTVYCCHRVSTQLQLTNISISVSNYHIACQRGSRLYSFFNIGASGGWVVNATPRPRHPGKDPVPVVQEAGWFPGPVWTGAENLAPLGFDSMTVQTVASC
jgi:hypothetical protein